MSLVRNVIYAGVATGAVYLILRALNVPVPGFASASSGAASSAPTSTTRTVQLPGTTRTVTTTIQLPGVDRVVTVPAAVAAPVDAATAVLNQLKTGLSGMLAPALPVAAGDALAGAGQFISSGSTTGFFAIGQNGAGQGTQYLPRDDEPLSGISSKIGDALQSIGSSISSITPLAGVFAVDAANEGFAGKGTRQQGKILGDASLKTAQFGVNYVPVVGAAISAALGAIGGTYEGKRFFGEVGRVEEQGYNVQKNLVNGDFNELGHMLGGGSTHKERVADFNEGINDRLAQLDQGGGVISNDDLQAFKTALSHGYDPTVSGHLGPYLPGQNGQLGTSPLSSFASWVNGLKAGQTVTAAYNQQAISKATAANLTKAQTDAKTQLAGLDLGKGVSAAAYVVQTGGQNAGAGAATFKVDTAGANYAAAQNAQVAAASSARDYNTQNAQTLASEALTGDSGALAAFRKLGLSKALQYYAQGGAA